MRTSESGTCTSALTWAPIIGGAVVAAAVSLILLALGSGLGFASASPLANAGASATKLAACGLIWLVVMQWISSGLGGYLTGRLRKRWDGVHNDEVHFRDTAHGFLAWALATVFVAAFLTSAASSIIGGAIQPMKPKDPNEFTAYYVDSLIRSDHPSVNTPDPEVRMITTRILVGGMKNGEIPTADKDYLISLVSQRGGFSQDEARKRVEQTITDARQAADKARKSTATFSIVTSLSLLIGAFIASVAAALGGKHRDEY